MNSLLKKFLGFEMTTQQEQNTVGGTTKVDPAWRKKERAAKKEARKVERASKKAEREAAREERGSGYDC